MSTDSTAGVNFINVKRTNFSYECRFSSYILALAKKSFEKLAHLTLVKLTPAFDFINAFHTHFLYKFFTGSDTPGNYMLGFSKVARKLGRRRKRVEEDYAGFTRYMMQVCTFEFELKSCL